MGVHVVGIHERLKGKVTVSVTILPGCAQFEDGFNHLALQPGLQPLATFRKRRGRWQAQVRRIGAVPVSRTFDTKAAAERWARGLERDIDEGKQKGRAADGTVAEMIDRYELEVRDLKPFGRTKLASLGLLRRGLGHIQLRDLDAAAVIRYARQRRTAGAGPVTMTVDLAYLGTILRTARALWRWHVSDEPVREARQALAMVGMVARSKARDRRPTEAETAALIEHWRANPRQTIPMGDLWLFAIASAMRLGEICRIRWSDLDVDKRIVIVRDRKDPRQKAGNDERIPLLPVRDLDPLEIILRQSRGAERIFPYAPDSASTAFTRACKALGIEGLNFHDSRHEAASRLFEAGYSIEQVALITGHKDWRTLRRYTQLKPEALVTLSLSRSLPASGERTPADRKPPSPSS